MVRVEMYAATRTHPASVMPSRAAVLHRKAISGGAVRSTGCCDPPGHDHATTSAAPSIVHDVLGSTGRPLDRAARGVMESSFGYDFSQVRVHSDATAARSAQRLGARAYAVADRLVFNQGEYRPESAEGRELLGHELAHVAQWMAGGSRPAAGHLSVARADCASEREADASAGPVSPMPFPVLHRKLSRKGSVSWGQYEIEMDTSSNGPAYDRVEISFTPAKTSPPTDEIQFIQIAKPALSPKMWTALHPDQADLEQFTTQEDRASGVKGDYHVDINPVRLKPREKGMPLVSPDYPHLKRTRTPTAPVTQPGGLTMGGGGVFTPQFGYHRPPDVRAAIMTDDPGGGPGAGTFNFETVAYDKNHGFGYGTVYWGFDYDPTPPKGTPNITNEKASVKTELSPTFIDALRRFQRFYKS